MESTSQFKASCTGALQLCGSNTQPVQASFSPPAGMVSGVKGRTGLPASSLCRRHAERPAHADAGLCWLPTRSKAIYPRLIPGLCLTLSLSRRYLHDAMIHDANATEVVGADWPHTGRQSCPQHFRHGQSQSERGSSTASKQQAALLAHTESPSIAPRTFTPVPSATVPPQSHPQKSQIHDCKQQISPAGQCLKPRSRHGNLMERI